MLTRLLRTIVSPVALVITTQGASAAQDRPENTILERAVAASRNAEPEWRFIAAILNASPLMDEQLGVAAGRWEKSSDGSTWVSVTIYAIATEDAAERWLYRQAHGEVATGWTVVPYEFGDGANMATYPDPRGFTQYNTAIRKGRFLAMLSGRSKETIERFANILIVMIQSLQSERGAVFEVDLWPGEGTPVFEAVAQQLQLHEDPSGASKVVEILAVKPKQQLRFDGTRYRTMKVGRFRVVARTTVTGRELGGIGRLSKPDYYSNKFGPAKVDVVPGDIIEYLQYRAEGTCFIRIAGSVIDADPCPTQKTAEFALEVEPDTEWWIQLTRGATPVGWLLITGSTAKVIVRKG